MSLTIRLSRRMCRDIYGNDPDSRYEIWTDTGKRKDGLTPEQVHLAIDHYMAEHVIPNKECILCKEHQ